MDGDEEICLGLVCDGRASLEWDESVIAASEDYVRAESLLEQLAKAQRDIENDILLLNPIGAKRSGVVAAVAGIDDDAADLKAKRAHHGASAVSGRVGFVDTGRGVV